MDRKIFILSYYLIFLSLTNALIFNKENERCDVRITGDLGDPQPLYMIHNTTEFIYPNNTDGVLSFEKNEIIEIFCDSNFSSPIGGVNSHLVSCVNGTTFKLYDSNYNFDLFNCTKYPYHIARRTNKTCANDTAIIVEIGFEIKNKFLQLLEVCHNEKLAHNYYVYYKQNPYNIGNQRNFSRPSWITGKFYDKLDVQNLYTINTQEKTLAKFLHSDKLAKDLIQSKQNLFLSRGHMAAKSDYVYGTQQRATFYFLNAAPQWQSFNGGNWETIETDVRKFVANRNIYIEIYTGTHGIMTYPDINGKSTELFLFYNQNGEHKIPIPKIYYKVLYEKKTQSGLVLIGVNNPYASLEEIKKDYIFCKDISDNITWIDWTKNDLYLGYSYACEFNDFANVVKILPDINVTSILL